MPSAAWRTERGSGGGIRTRTVASFEEADSADWSTPPSVGTPGAIRTRTSCGLNAVTPASWSTGAWCPPRGIEPGTCCLQGSCSAAELDGRKMNKRLGRPTGAAGSLFLIVHNVKQRDPKARLSSRFSLLLEHDVFRKTVPTFRHHALGPSTRAAARADTRNFQKQRGELVPNRRVGRAHDARAEPSLRGIPRAFPSCLSAEGFRPPPG